MHPALSVIFFTTASGAGYGLLLLLCLLGSLEVLPENRWFGFTGFLIAFSLITAGLFSSTFHLGHPERAWRAVTQWRSSWLSREGVVSLFTYIPSGLFAIGWVFFEERGGLWAAFGVLGAVSALATIYCTAMIYASLKTIRQWNNPWVAQAYLALGFATGALWLVALAGCFGAARPLYSWMAVTGLLVALVVKLIYWRSIDSGRSVSTPGTATGLSKLGPVKPLELPHTQDNYLMREMGFQLARKHSRKLRLYSLGFAFALPLACLLIGLAVGGAPAVALWILGLASAMLGVFVERWLFFAEATHVVTLYYGRQAA